MQSLQDGLATVNGRQPVDFDVNNTVQVVPEGLRT